MSPYATAAVASGRYSWPTVETPSTATKSAGYQEMYSTATISPAEPSIDTAVAVRAESRSVAQPPTNDPSTAPAPYTPSATPACRELNPRWVRNTTRKISKNPARRPTSTPARIAFTARGVARNVATTPSDPVSPAGGASGATA